ncbi:MAG: hypothetical protein II937_06140 [Bacteroidales bacterium]|nr:hypothetical protein [Bacteroidales bacterium]
MEFLTQYIEDLMTDGGTTDNRQIRELYKKNGVDLDQNISKVKEAVELGLMHTARNIAQNGTLSLRQKYDKLIDVYNRQPYVGTKKTLKQMILQQYSTPLPIAFLMSEFVKSNSNSALYFEPAAGNGFLTVSLPQENTICNEIDSYRLDNLRSEHYRKVTEQDSRQKFEYNRIFDGVVTNPPFLKEIDTMIFNALDTMKDNGRCAILRDGLNEFEPYYGTLHRRKFVGFYDKLFQEYNVVKIINLNTKKIYAKQGTAFFMHIILIDGRRAKKGSDNETIHRVFNPEIDKTELAGFEELWEYFSPYFSENTEIKNSPILEAELGLLIQKNDVFVETLKQNKKNYITQKDADEIKWYIVTDIYEDGYNTNIAANVTSRVDGCYKIVVPIDIFLSKKLKYAYHAHQLDGLKSSAKAIAKNIKNAVINITLPTIKNNSGYTLKNIPNTLADRKKLLRQELSPLVGSSEFCKNLHDDVHIYSHLPIREIMNHSAISKDSTLAALNLIEVIKNAVRVGKPSAPHSNVQLNRGVAAIIEMRCKIKGVGTVKLTIAKKKQGEYTAYCLTKFRYEKIERTTKKSCVV